MDIIISYQQYSYSIQPAHISSKLVTANEHFFAAEGEKPLQPNVSSQIKVTAVLYWVNVIDVLERKRDRKSGVLSDHKRICFSSEQLDT